MTYYEEILDVQSRIAENTDDFKEGSDCELKNKVNVAWFIGPPYLLTLAIKMAQNLQTIHQVASAGCPVGELPDATFEAISQLCAEAKYENAGKTPTEVLQQFADANNWRFGDNAMWHWKGGDVPFDIAQEAISHKE